LCPILVITSTGGAGVLHVRMFDLSVSATAMVQNGFNVVVYKP